MQCWVSPSGKIIDVKDGDDHAKTIFENPELFDSKVVAQVKTLEAKYGDDFDPFDEEDDNIDMDSEIQAIIDDAVHRGWSTVSSSWKHGITIFARDLDERTAKNILGAISQYNLHVDTPIVIIYGYSGKFKGTVGGILSNGIQEGRFRRLLREASPKLVILPDRTSRWEDENYISYHDEDSRYHRTNGPALIGKNHDVRLFYIHGKHMHREDYLKHFDIENER